MKTLSFTVCFALLFAHSALAANPIHSLHPDDTDALKPAGVDVSYSVIVNDEKNPEFAFTVSVEVPAGIDSLDAYFVVRNGKGLLTASSWSTSQGKCIASFTVGKQVLKDAHFAVQHNRGKRTDAFSASGGYALNLSEFANDSRFRRSSFGKAIRPESTTDFVITHPIRRNGPDVAIAVTRKDSPSNHHYDFAITVTGHAAHHIHIRNGQPITNNDIRLADLNADGFLDLMIVGGTDHRGSYCQLLCSRNLRQRRLWVGSSC